eukprot:TRINITY_DN6142_c0_g1_i2.p1 TRINITY_DN6142_c0_g1~~TRINITY_DN6142_c0_g1_i2.p1  ORF type:complete len:386 (+),score=80.59 TRINITY_DN6142_c0_g1_i2:149-1306(+)
MNLLIECYLKSGKQDKARQLFFNLRSMNLLPNPYTYVIMITDYTQDRSLIKNLVTEFRQLGKNRKIPRDLYHYILKNLVKVNDYETAFEIVEDMQKRGYSYFSNLTIILSSMVKNMPFEEVYEQFLEKGKTIKYGIGNYNLIMSHLITEDRLDEAKFLIESSSNVKPDVITYSTLLKGYFKKGNLSNVTTLFNDIKADPKIREDRILYTILIDGYFKNNEPEKALEVFHSLTVQPDLPLWRSVIYELIQYDKLDSACDVLEQIISKRVYQVDASIFEMVVKKLIEKEQYEKAVSYIREMDEYFDLKISENFMDYISEAMILCGLESQAEEFEAKYLKKMNAPRKEISEQLLLFSEKRLSLIKKKKVQPKITSTPQTKSYRALLRQ